MADKSPSPKLKQTWRKITFRLRPEQMDEANVLQDYDARSKLLGRADHDYIRRLLLVGHLFVSKLEVSELQSLALSTNESNNTEKEHLTASNNESQQQEGKGPVTAVAFGEAEPGEVVGSAIRGMAGIFGPAKKATS